MKNESRKNIFATFIDKDLKKEFGSFLTFVKTIWYHLMEGFEKKNIRNLLPHKVFQPKKYCRRMNDSSTV